ncbi:MAG: N-acetylglucosamine-6-phosphate deacetylase [Candidatus Nanopelagicales bacterium]
MTVFAGGRVVTDQGLVESGWVEVEGELIVDRGIGEPIKPVDFDLHGRALIPGFVDQHCHGGGGNTFITTDAAEAFRAAELHLRHGTTSIMASLVTGTREALTEQIRTLTPLVDQDVLLGIHLEGPWLSTLHCGAHDSALLRAPDSAEVGELLAVGGGRIKMVTIAPELPGSIQAIHQILRADAVVAIGHTDANYEQAKLAIAAGATVATHLSNAMRPLHHRDPGAIGALMEDPRVTVELIADGVHVHPAVLRLVHNEAGTARVALITDAMGAAGAPDGRYLLGQLEVDVVDGTARLVEGGAIAGSTLTLDWAMRYVVLEGGVSLDQVVQMLSTNPARMMGLDDRGVIAPGKRADLLVLGPRLEVESVMRRGDWVHGPGV